jgi:hypothetical protein
MPIIKMVHESANILVKYNPKTFKYICSPRGRISMWNWSFLKVSNETQWSNDDSEVTIGWKETYYHAGLAGTCCRWNYADGEIGVSRSTWTHDEKCFI